METTCSKQPCVQVDLMLLQPEASREEPSEHENRFELVQKKLKGLAVSSFGTLQIPSALGLCR